MLDDGQEQSIKTADSACPIQRALMLRGGSTWIRENRNIHVFVMGSHNAHIRNHAWNVHLLCHRATFQEHALSKGVSALPGVVAG